MSEIDFNGLMNRAAIGASFTAAFTTDNGCTSCGDDLLEGETIGYVDDELVCADCYAIARDAS